MSDTSTTPVPQTDPLAKGSTTSEYKVSMLATILGVLATVVGYASSILDILPQNLKWVGVATAITGMLTACLTAIGYTVTRGNVKAAAISASQAVVPMVPVNQAAAQVFKPA